MLDAFNHGYLLAIIQMVRACKDLSFAKKFSKIFWSKQNPACSVQYNVCGSLCHPPPRPNNWRTIKNLSTLFMHQI